MAPRWVMSNRTMPTTRNNKSDPRILPAPMVLPADTSAQTRLGECYLRGFGTVTDLVQARFWLEGAAEKGQHRPDQREAQGRAHAGLVVQDLNQGARAAQQAPADDHPRGEGPHCAGRVGSH